MARILSARQIKKLDEIAMEKCSIPSIVLMENAGRKVAEEMFNLAKKVKNVCVFCGVGNNGGDGFVAARYLGEKDIKADCFVIGKVKDLKSDAATNYRILKKLGYKTFAIDSAARFVLEKLKKADVIVDAIFGVGLNREVGEPFKSIINLINKSKKKVISIDVPSGLDATTGKLWGACVKADRTITFSCAKKGFYINSGRQYTGKVIIADIGIPKKLYFKV